MGGQMRQVDHAHPLVTNLDGQPIELLVRQHEKLVEQTKLVHQFQRRRMDGIAAEVAKEIGVLLQHHDIDAGAREKKAKHHPGRPAAGDAALGRNRRIRHHGSGRQTRARRLRETWAMFKPAAGSAATRQASSAGSKMTWCIGTPAASPDKRNGTPFVPSARPRGSRRG